MHNKKFNLFALLSMGLFLLIGFIDIFSWIFIMLPVVVCFYVYDIRHGAVYFTSGDISCFDYILYTVCAVEQAEGSVMLDNLQLDKTKKYAIVMGNEVKGVQQNVVDNCDICIEIPQYGTKHSLNVSVTTGIVIWDFFKQLSD